MSFLSIYVHHRKSEVVLGILWIQKDKVIYVFLLHGVMSLLTEKGWNKLSNPDEVKEVEVKALFNMIDKDQSGELSLEVSLKK